MLDIGAKKPGRSVRSPPCSGRLCRELDPQGSGDLDDGLKARLGARGQGLVQTLSAETCILGDLGHPFGASDIGKRQEQEMKLRQGDEGHRVAMTQKMREQAMKERQAEDKHAMNLTFQQRNQALKEQQAKEQAKAKPAAKKASKTK